jgi:hypothetical protein
VKKNILLIANLFIFLSLCNQQVHSSQNWLELGCISHSSSRLLPGATPRDEFLNKDNVLTILKALKQGTQSEHESYQLVCALYPKQPLQNSVEFLINYLDREDIGINYSTHLWQNNNAELYVSWSAFKYDDSEQAVNFSFTWTRK